MWLSLHVWGIQSIFYEGYEDEYALHPGFKNRKILYNLYHELNHFNLFGGGYASSTVEHPSIGFIIMINADLEKVILSAEEINSRILEIAEEISQHYQDTVREIILSPLDGAIVFTADLIRHLSVPIRFDCCGFQLWELNKPENGSWILGS